jgi:pSer/pThr/pTyr-binding forkhead associated (FHA) protein
VRTNEAFAVKAPVFRIGADRNYSDLHIFDNTYISRNHAQLITRNDRFYIVDCRSTNKTYVDGKLIPSDMEIELFSGTKIRLANEDFIFTIES